MGHGSFYMLDPLLARYTSICEHAPQENIETKQMSCSDRVRLKPTEQVQMFLSKWKYKKHKPLKPTILGGPLPYFEKAGAQAISPPYQYPARLQKLREESNPTVQTDSLNSWVSNVGHQHTHTPRDRSRTHLVVYIYIYIHPQFKMDPCHNLTPSQFNFPKKAGPPARTQPAPRAKGEARIRVPTLSFLLSVVHVSMPTLPLQKKGGSLRAPTCWTEKMSPILPRLRYTYSWWPMRLCARMR